MTVRQAKLHPATVKAIADYLETDVEQLISSFQEPDGSISPANVAQEVRKVRVWIEKLRASLQHSDERSVTK
jgi:hypothetical protein